MALNSFSLKLKSMGVINLTPNSFSDGGLIKTPEDLKTILHRFGEEVQAIDLGAESTAPMNSSIGWELEWERLKIYLPYLKFFPGALSFDTYHVETMEEILRYYHDHDFHHHLIWNDVSGKFDGFVKDFLSLSPKFFYVLCHNLSPTRNEAGRHMDFIDPALSVEKLSHYFLPHKSPQVIFDPGLGFSKTYEQNWMIMEEFPGLQELTGHYHWLLGFSRKSFLRKKMGILELNSQTLGELDSYHQKILNEMHPKLLGEVWIRTHCPELMSSSFS